MPFIRVKKPGVFGEAFLGDKAYEWVEVDDTGQPMSQPREIQQQPVPEKQPGQMSRGYSPRGRPNTGKTEPLIREGVRAPDTSKGYSKPFNYHLWNKIRKFKKSKK